MYLHMSKKSRTFAIRKIHYKPFKIIEKMKTYITTISSQEEMLLLRLLHKFMMTAKKDCDDSHGGMWIESQNTMLLLDDKDILTLVGLLDKQAPLRPFVQKVSEWLIED